jgi:hypothetical protein
MEMTHESEASIAYGETVYDMSKNYPELVKSLIEFYSKEYPGMVSNDFDVQFGEINFSPSPSSGTLTLHSNGEVTVAIDDHEGPGRLDTIETTFNGKWTCEIVINESGRLANPNGVLYDFKGDAERSLSGQPFSIESPDLSGVLPVIQATDEQIKSCAPFIEFKYDTAGKVTGIEVRFVNPSSDTSTPLTRGAANPIRFDRIRVSFSETGAAKLGTDSLFRSVGKDFQEGDPLTYTVNFVEEGIEPLESSDIEGVDIQFIRIRDGEDIVRDGVELYYLWSFNNFEASIELGPKPGKPIEPPTEEVVEGAESAAGELAEMPTEFVVATEAVTGSKTTVFVSDAAMSAFTSSAIKVEQPVDRGGAAVVGSFELPLNPTSFGGTSLPVATTSKDVMEQYRLLKYFEKGGAVDLIEKFGFDNILDASAPPNLKFKPVLVVIDGPVPPKEIDTTTIRVYNDLYGVRLSSDKQYLYVYDGYENGTASDPIALVAKDEDKGKNGNTSSGGSGCNAGYGLFGLLPLAVWVARKRMTA